jgi:N-acetylmuramoyl-L-alanine amidase
MKYKKHLFFSLLALSAVFLFHRHLPFQAVMNSSVSSSQVVIDVGHGGDDPGKIGINQAQEKDINLKIGQSLYRMLSTSGYTVTMTRTQDQSLASSGSSNQKRDDLNQRKEIMNQAAPMAIVSIHQNSYTSESEHGTQVFYPAGQEEGKLLASCIQEQCRRILDPDNKRQIKENSEYYLFRDNPYPIVIVECGFLSNYQEANLLITDAYQEKVAWSIYLGVVQYLKTLE